MQQTKLLEEANRRLDQRLKNSSSQPEPVRIEKETLDKPVNTDKPVKMIEREPDFNKSAMAFHSSSNVVQKESSSGNHSSLTFKFDALKTPSYFLSKNSTLEKSTSSQINRYRAGVNLT